MLRTYERNRDERGGYLIPISVYNGKVNYYRITDESAQEQAESKRFSEAELAAECQRMSHEFDIAKYGLEADPYVGRTRDWESAGDRAETLNRFATYPHYDESND